MKKTRKVTPAQLQKLIQEEAIRQKRILDLKQKREEVVKQLNEIYETDEYVDEGISDFILGSKEKWKQKIVAWYTENKMKHPDANIEIPQGQDLEDAAEVARRLGEFRIVKRDGKWVPTHYVKSDVGSSFDGSGTAE